jgi:DNA helicase-2/ATP-dependent DNA helicase PcrA
LDLTSLNDAQREAVLAPDGAMLVVAGAGTGKTRTLVHRVAALIERGVPPHAIVLLTFTRRAAAEMLDRASRLVGPRAMQVRGGTFHGFGNQMLRRHAQKLGYTNRFTLLDRADASSLVGLVRSELGYGGKAMRFPQKGTVLDLISKAANTGRPLGALAREEVPQYGDIGEALERVAEAYTARKLKSDVMDYDDLLTRFLELLEGHAEARNRIAEACEHVLVDEYQDTNHVQAQIACMLASYHGNLTVVGDEAQSIYGFRGARVRNILDFPSLFEDCRTVVLDQNYRSVQPILDFANAVLASASEGFEKHLHSDIVGDDKPVLWAVEDDEEQPARVLGELRRLHETGVAYRDMAVLVRSGWHANLLEVGLTKERISFRKFGGIRFSDAAHVKDLLAMLRVVVNPKDDVAWFRCISWLEGVGEKTAQKLSESLADGSFDRESVARKKYGPLVRSLLDVIEAARGATTAVGAFDAAMTWYRGLFTQLYEDASKREKDLITLRVLAESASSLDGMLAELTLDPVDESGDEEDDQDDDWLTVSTIHSAKGLEWDVVFVLGLADGHFPSGYAVEDADAMDEERRLFYVAVTRARKRLYLLRPSFVRGAGARGFGQSCALLDELKGLRGLVERPRRAAVAPVRDPKLADAEARMARFLQYFGKKN